MSNDWYNDVLEFQEATESYVGALPTVPPKAIKDLRRALVHEEMMEFFDALNGDDLPALADAAADVTVVVLGTMVSYGIDLRPVWDLVHRANMAKAGGPRRDDGKILKPLGWQPPNVKAELQRQGGN